MQKKSVFFNFSLLFVIYFDIILAKCKCRLKIFDGGIFFGFTFSGLLNGCDILRSDYVSKDNLDKILAALTYENELVLRVCISTGLRVGDVLLMRSDKLAKRMSIRELKTGKIKRIFLSDELLDKLIRNSGKIWVFSGRLDYRKHRSRQAVWKDVKRAAKAFRMPQNVTPHSTRKYYAVKALNVSDGDLKAVQKSLNHSDPAVTMVYAMADSITAKKMKKKSPAKGVKKRDFVE